MTTATSVPSYPARRIERLLAEYGESHRSLVNVAMHWIAVPVTCWSVLALLSRLPFPDAWRVVPGLDWAVAAVILATLYYATLSVPLAAGLAAVQVLCLGLTAAFVRWGDLPVWQLAIFLLVLAWGLQALGHKLEERRRSLLKDAQLLPIGPLWLLASVYRLLGVRY